MAVGEAEPLNLDYGRAEMFGDHFTVWAEADTGTADLGLCYPNDAHGTTDALRAVGKGFCNEFDTMEGFPDSLSEEASITSTANGDFLCGVWGQFSVEQDPDTGERVFVDGDSMFRRIWYLDDYISQDNAWTLPGTNGGTPQEVLRGTYRDVLDLLRRSVGNDGPPFFFSTEFRKQYRCRDAFSDVSLLCPGHR